MFLKNKDGDNSLLAHQGALTRFVTINATNHLHQYPNETTYQWHAVYSWVVQLTPTL